MHKSQVWRKNPSLLSLDNREWKSFCSLVFLTLLCWDYHFDNSPLLNLKSRRTTISFSLINAPVVEPQSGVVITKMLIQVTAASRLLWKIQEVESRTKYHFLAISGEDGFFRDIYSQSRLMTLLHGGQRMKKHIKPDATTLLHMERGTKKTLKCYCLLSLIYWRYHQGAFASLL